MLNVLCLCVQVLLRKRRMYNQTMWYRENPKKWRELNQRIKFLYKFLNHKTKTGPNPAIKF